MAREYAAQCSSYHPTLKTALTACGEAVQVGLPCVASYTGGNSEPRGARRTGQLFPTGDVPLLAEMILRIFETMNLACRLSRAARAEASQRTSPSSRVAMLNAYNHVIAGQGVFSEPTFSVSGDKRYSARKIVAATPACCCMCELVRSEDPCTIHTECFEGQNQIQ